MAPVNLVVVHHEGAGVPTDYPRGAEGGYSYWLGASYWTRLRPPVMSYATKGFNHRSADICLSGNREVVNVTDRDIEMIRQVCADMRNRDELTDSPQVVAHKNSPGSVTVCPGGQTMKRWAEIVAACQVPTVTPKPEEDDVPKPTDVVDVLDTTHGRWQLTADGGVRTIRGKFHGSYPGLPAAARQGVRYFMTITARPDGKAGYVLVGSDGSEYLFPT